MVPDLEPIRSPRNPRVQRALRLQERRHRREQGRILLDTPHLIEEGLAAGLAWEEAFFVPERAGALAALLQRLRAAGARVHPVEPRVMERLASTATPQGIAAVARMPPPLPPEDLLEQAGTAVLALDGVQDPVNVGAMVRSARAFGLKAVLLGEGTADLFHPRALRASAGAALQVAWCPCYLPSALQQARRAGWTALGMDPRQGEPPEALAGISRYALVVGSEGQGLSEAVRACLDGYVRVPMCPGVESLNAAVAVGIALYVLQVQQGRAGNGDGRERVRG